MKDPARTAERAVAGLAMLAGVRLLLQQISIESCDSTLTRFADSIQKRIGIHEQRLLRIYDRAKGRA